MTSTLSHLLTLINLLVYILDVWKDLIPRRFIYYAIGFQLSLQALLGAWAWYKNPDGTPAKIPWTPPIKGSKLWL